jgi:two-component system sensor histidine kinase KdpD
MRRLARSAFGVPLVGTLLTVLLSTVILLIVDARVEVPHLVIGYLLPTTLIAIAYGSTPALLASVICGVGAAFFLFPPRFSLYIANPLHIAELGFFILLALIASKATALVAHDPKVRKSIAGR